MSMDDVLGNVFIEERSVGGKVAWMLAFVTVSGDEIRAVGGAIDGDFALGPATDRANRFGLCGAEARSFAFFTNWTGHGRSPAGEDKAAEYAEE